MIKARHRLHIAYEVLPRKENKDEFRIKASFTRALNVFETAQAKLKLPTPVKGCSRTNTTSPPNEHSPVDGVRRGNEISQRGNAFAEVRESCATL